MDEVRRFVICIRRSLCKCKILSKLLKPFSVLHDEGSYLLVPLDEVELIAFSSALYHLHFNWIVAGAKCTAVALIVASFTSLRVSLE